MEKVGRNVAHGVRYRRPGGREVVLCLAEGGLCFLAAAEDTPLFPLYVLLAMVGLCRCEALALEWRDVDLEAGRLKVFSATG